ncbi:MAG: tetratricopeptide repeat protein [Polyangiales bacterium]|nr:tetratricopeptide repeat protein [Sandaracinus sp.]
MRMPKTSTLLALAIASGLGAAALGTSAQLEGLDENAFVVAEPGAPGEPDELRAWSLIRQQKLVEAREVAERIVAERPNSFLGHLLLGWAHHYGEANFPKALFHEERAYALFTERYGEPPRPDAPWRWHARMLLELADTHGDLEHHEERLAWIARYNEYYDPDLLADQAWALMKLGHYDLARRVSDAGMATGNPRERLVALNAYCAIEFEAGHVERSYEACRAALDDARRSGSPNAVDLTNFAEASRSLFKLDEAERMLQEATEAEVAWYGNPWLELAELYTRGARFPEALSALRKVLPYRAQRPPHVRDADRNEHRRALASFYLVVGQPEEALGITEKALVMPDRRAHNSRDPDQDRALTALIDRRARLAVGDVTVERAVGGPLQGRLIAHLERARLGFEAWMSGRQSARLLSQPPTRGGEDRLVGFFRIGTSASAITPPWLAGELSEVVGAGVTLEAVERARRTDERTAAGAYYDAFAAEASYRLGDETRAKELAERARGGLPDGDALLRARVDAIRAAAIRDSEGTEAAIAAYELALQNDPGVFRRLGLPLPVRLVTRGQAEPVEELADALARSPRFDEDDEGLRLVVSGDAAVLSVCLEGSGGTQLDCSEANVNDVDENTAWSAEETPEAVDVETFVARAARLAQERLFAPRIDLSQADIGSLDGSNRVARDPMEGLRGGRVTPP